YNRHLDRINRYEKRDRQARAPQAEDAPAAAADQLPTRSHGVSRRFIAYRFATSGRRQASPPPTPIHFIAATNAYQGMAVLSNMDAKDEARLEDIQECKYEFVVNQIFGSEEEFYQFYNNYAKGKDLVLERTTVHAGHGSLSQNNFQLQ
ncbi:hypothetical protein EJB05_44350, partial [Eragrostis curvula]